MSIENTGGSDPRCRTVPHNRSGKQHLFERTIESVSAWNHQKVACPRLRREASSSPGLTSECSPRSSINTTTAEPSPVRHRRPQYRRTAHETLPIDRSAHDGWDVPLDCAFAAYSQGRQPHVMYGNRMRRLIRRQQTRHASWSEHRQWNKAASA
jgi:hypothetical protein